jgi:hypothetical protein
MGFLATNISKVKFQEKSEPSVCFSFVDFQGNVIDFTQSTANDYFNNLPGKISVNKGVITSTLVPEDTS